MTHDVGSSHPFALPLFRDDVFLFFVARPLGSTSYLQLMCLNCVSGECDCFSEDPQRRLSLLYHVSQVLDHFPEVVPPVTARDDDQLEASFVVAGRSLTDLLFVDDLTRVEGLHGGCYIHLL